MKNNKNEFVKPGGLDLKDKLVSIQRVTKVTKGGRAFGFTAIVIVGDENGTEHSFITAFKDTWGNGKFYATLPWEWARYQAMSLVRPGSKGHSIQFFFSKGMQGAANVSESDLLV